MNWKKIVLLFFIFLLVHSSCVTQEVKDALGKVNIASPNTASLGKYIDIPVDYHTGVPNINIPIYTVTEGSLKLPVSISYHSAGLRVDENASWVGAGWTLNAGGAIMRTVKDKPDEKRTSRTDQDYGYYSDFGIASYWLLEENENNIVDNEPDLFFFNFNGYTGKFHFNDSREPILMSQQDLKIECSYTPGQWNNSPGAISGGLGRCIESFIITTPDGVKYYFGIDQQNPQPTLEQPIEVNNTATSINGADYAQVISGWYLYKMVSPDGNSAISFTYEREKFAYYTFSNPPTSNLDGAPIFYRYARVKNLVSGVRLKNIIASNEKIVFNPGNPRQDIGRWSWGPDENLNDATNDDNPGIYPAMTLASISIVDITSSCFKKFNLLYDYFNDDTPISNEYFSGIISDKKRLKLLSLQESTCNSSSVKPPYQFIYYDGVVPRKLSFGRDHWGFSNGITTNEHLYPPLYNNNGLISLFPQYASREPVFTAMRAGTLRQITYPTGGYTEFTYEANEVAIKNHDNTFSNVMVGGLRISSIKQYDPASQKSILTNYEYKKFGSTATSGVLYSQPTYIQLFRSDWLKETTLGSLNGCWTTEGDQVVKFRDYIYSDNSLRPMETTQGYHLGYGEVKVRQTGNGYTVYRYRVTPSWAENFDKIAITKINDPGTCDVAIPNYPPAPLEHDYYRGEMIYSGVFTEAGKTIKETELTPEYTYSNVTTPGAVVWDFNPGLPYRSVTFYELKTAKRTKLTRLERTFDEANSNSLEKQIIEYYESPYHNQVTKITETNGQNGLDEKRIKYTADFRAASFDNITNCFASPADFLSYYRSIYHQTYKVQLANCNNNVECINTTTNAFLTAVFGGRSTYITCRKTNYTNLNPLNNYQAAHNAAKNSADPGLKPILWMQDINMNAPVELSQWKNGKLLNSVFNKYSNHRDDEFGVYPEKTYRIDLASPSELFTASTVNSDGQSVVKDGRYTDFSALAFDNGRLISITQRDGVPESYEWGYKNNFPTVKVINALNDKKESVQQTPLTVQDNFCFEASCGSPSSSNIILTFQQTQAGKITVSIQTGLPNNTKLTVTGTLQLAGTSAIDPINFCISGIGGESCETSTFQVEFPNKPAGNYTLSCTAEVTYSGSTIPFTRELACEYQGEGMVSTGGKEFFYEGFEEDAAATVGNAYAGRNFHTGIYQVPFVKPNNRAYTISYHYLSNARWRSISKVFSDNMTLSDGTAIDEVRVYPVDAQMTTYTYDPLIGMTSEANVNGKVTKYEYDGFGRLSFVRDEDNYILKRYQYAYQSANPTKEACSETNCKQKNEKCINGFCEKAQRINTSTKLMQSGPFINKWRCNYYLKWSDGTIYPVNPADRLSENNSYPCDINE